MLSPDEFSRLIGNMLVTTIIWVILITAILSVAISWFLFWWLS